MSRITIILIISFLISLPVIGSAAPKITEGDAGTGWVGFIDYPGKWQGVIGADMKISSVSGTGPEYFSFSGMKMSLSMNIQKCDDSNRVLKIKIYKDRRLIDEGETDAAYGVCMVPVALYDY